MTITISKSTYPVFDWKELPNTPLPGVEPEAAEAIREGALTREHNGEQHSLFVSFSSRNPFPQGTVFTAGQENYEVTSLVGAIHRAKLL